MKKSLVVSFVLCLFYYGCKIATNEPLADERPNVIMISVDDMNDWVSSLNSFQMLKTPNLDRLAGMGTLFSNAYCAAPLCNPSRTAILTGMSPSRTGIVDNSKNENGVWKLRWPELNTMPLWFKKNGYTVVGGGKIYHETDPELFNPLHQWDEYYPLEIEKFKQKPHIEKLGIKDREWFSDMPNHPNGSWDWGPFFCDDFDMGDGKTTRWAMEFLEKDHDKPFFLALGLFHPHLPFYAPKKYFDNIPLDSVRIPDAPEWDLLDLPIGATKYMRAGNDENFQMVVENNELKNAIRAYLASIAYVDALVGYLLESLEKSRYAKNTIIVFWSDHGYQFGEKQRMAKRSLWNRSTRVLFTVKAPGITTPGMISEQPVSLMDIYPTLLELCSLPDPGHELDGVSLKPQLKNPIQKREPVVITQGLGNDAICNDRWTYISYRDGGEELYDRTNDANQWYNLAQDKSHDSLKKELKKWLPKNQGIKLKSINKIENEK